MEAIQIHLFFLPELCLAFLNGLNQRFFRLLGNYLFLTDCRRNLRILHVQEFKQLALKSCNIGYRNIQQILVGSGINDNNLVLYSHRLILRLLQNFLNTFALCELLLGIRIQIGSKL